MVFFDLNIPYIDDATSAATKSSGGDKKSLRLKTVVKLLELGYTGVAHDKSIKGVMSDKDRCTIAPYPISSLLKASPNLAESVKFHREILGVPISDPFRQYRRLTVVVDSVIKCSVLNSGNPVLKTYDLVAVRPLNQVALDQACKTAEVDMIAIDFSQKLPFRLKFSTIKVAIERGVYFEITYSNLISHAQSKREMLPNAKMLVNWTKGKNLIISSAAPTANEVRGPYDIANLFSLFGLSTERAKSAVSRNCRTLLTNALRKRQFYKRAIRVENISFNEPNSNQDDMYNNWSKWDPISSGDGDLPSLDELDKFFSDTTNKVSVLNEVSLKNVFSSDSVLHPDNLENSSSQNFKLSFASDFSNQKRPFITESPSNGNLQQSSAPPTCDESDLPSSLEPASVVTEQENVTTVTLMEEVYHSPMEDTITENVVEFGSLDEDHDSLILHPKIIETSDTIEMIAIDGLESHMFTIPKCHHQVNSCGTLKLCDNSMQIDSPTIVGDEDNQISKVMPMEKSLSVQDDFVNESFAETNALTNKQKAESDSMNDVVIGKENFDMAVEENVDLMLKNVVSTGQVQEEEPCASVSLFAEKRRMEIELGKRRLVQKLRRFKIPSTGLLKPLLFRKKIKKKSKHDK